MFYQFSDQRNINHQFGCNEKCLDYLLTCKKCLKQYVGQTIDTSRDRWNNYKSNKEFQRSEPYMQEHLFRHFSSRGHNSFLNDFCVTFINKMDPSDPGENFWQETLLTMAPYGLNIEDSVWVLLFDNIEVGTFYSAYTLHFLDHWKSLFFRNGFMEDEFV